MEKETPSPNLSADIFAVLKDRIIHWEYLPDHRFTEIGLSEEFGVSRSPIREVLQMLEKSGLVVKEPRQGYVVRQPGLQEVYELYEFRMALELYLIECLAEEGMDPIIWQKIHDQWQNYLSNLPNIDKNISVQDESFHESLAKAAGKPLLVQKLQEVNERLHFIRANDITTPERLMLTCQQHLSILEAIKNRDAQEARKAIKENIIEGRQNVDHAIKEALAKAYLMARSND